MQVGGNIKLLALTTVRAVSHAGVLQALQQANGLCSMSDF